MSYEKPSHKTKKKNCCKNVNSALIGISIIILLLSIFMIIYSAFTYYTVQDLTVVDVIQNNGIISAKPYTKHFVAASIPILRTLPNDLSDYIGAEYTIISTTAQSHKITISSGSLSTTWDGVNTVLTFGGSIGDGLKFNVISKNRIVITSPINIALS